MRISEDDRQLLVDFMDGEVKKAMFKVLDEALRDQQLQLTKLRVDIGAVQLMHSVARAEGAGEMVTKIKAILNKLKS